MTLQEKAAAASPLLDHCPPSLPASYYLDAGHFDREQKMIWSRSWVYAGRVNDLPPMTMRRITVAGQNLILVRDAEGSLSSFHNTCRHRGAELCSEQQKTLKSRLITCPYHQWSYDFSGALARTPFVSVPADFDKADHGLFPVSVKKWNGFIFLCLADELPDFATVPDLGPQALDNWPMNDLVTGHTMTAEIGCNWKIFWENYNECLHCPGIHPELCDMVPVYRGGYMAQNEAAQWNGQSVPGADGLKPGARTWTMSGAPCGPEFPQLTASQREAGHFFVTLLPAMFVVAHVDYVRAVSLRPLGPERTELKAEWLFLPETLAATGFDLGQVVGFAETVLRQDAAACEMNQRGLRCAKFTHGTLMPQEYALHDFHQWVRRHLTQQNNANGEQP